VGVAVLGGFRALEWAWQEVFLQIDRNLENKENYEKIFKKFDVRVWVAKSCLANR